MNNKKWELEEEISEEVSRITIDFFGVRKEEVTPETNFKEDLGAEIPFFSSFFSLFIWEVENTFVIRFEFDEIDKILTVKNLIDGINKKIL